jgi:hypothetical protein
MTKHVHLLSIFHSWRVHNYPHLLTIQHVQCILDLYSAALSIWLISTRWIWDELIAWDAPASRVPSCDGISKLVTELGNSAKLVPSRVRRREGDSLHRLFKSDWMDGYLLRRSFSSISLKCHSSTEISLDPSCFREHVHLAIVRGTHNTRTLTP